LEEERHQPTLDSDAKCNDALNDARMLNEKGCAVVETQSLRISEVFIELRNM